MRRCLAIVAIALTTSACTATTPRPATTPQARPSGAATTPPPRRVADGTPRPSAPIERAVRRVAERFFLGYLRLTYGHPTTNRTVRNLVDAPPNVPMAVRRLHPRVVRLALEWAGPTRVTVLATINDGRAVYPVAIRLIRQGSHFRVVALEP